MQNGDLIIYTRKPYFWRSQVKFFGVFYNGKIVSVKNGKHVYSDLLHPKHIPYCIRVPEGREIHVESYMLSDFGTNTLELVNYIHDKKHNSVLMYV